MPEILTGIERLTAAGKVRRVGLSNWSCGRLVEAFAGGGPAHPVALEYPPLYLQPRPEADFDGQVQLSAEISDLARQHGSTLMAYSVLLNGTSASSSEQLAENLAGTLLRLTVEQRAELDQAGFTEQNGKEPAHDRA